MKITYKVGDVIEYRTFDGKLRKVKVTNQESNIKNGRAGFDGEMSDGETVWGYDDQITRILS